jgi:dienelactone hydrolase
MAAPAVTARLAVAARVAVTAGVVVTLVATGAACSSSGQPNRKAKSTVSHLARKKLPSRTTATAHVVGVLGSYWVGLRDMTFTEPAHTGPTGEHLGPRVLLTEIRYPLAGRPRPGTPRAKGRFPLLVFAPGFMQCGGPYGRMLKAWASAGYVVVVVDFPHSDCKVGGGATEADMVNQPHDMSYVITRILALSAAPHGLLAGILSKGQIGVTGQSDGGDTVAAIAANTCCADHRVAAVAVLSGQEWAHSTCPVCQLTGRYFTRRPVPILFAQGSADVLNSPATSKVMYRADRSRLRYYLDLLGASHTSPYWGTNPTERIVVRVTLAFFDRFVLGQIAQGPVIKRDGNVAGLAILASGRQPPPK